MSRDYSITIGTTGRGTWNSLDGGESWMLQRKWFFPPESPIVRALTLHPSEPHTVYAGGDRGVHRSTDNGRNWELISRAGDLANVWSVAICPDHPNTMFAGVSPTGLHRSRNGGYTWERLSLPPLATECEVGDPRVTQIVIDPDDSRIIWAGIEVDGILRSTDEGDTWQRVPVPDEDIHSMVIATGSPKQVFALTPRDLYVTTDMGESWEPMGTKRFANAENSGRYRRWLTHKPNDHRVMFMGTGSFNVGDSGNVFRSMDFGRTWAPVALSKRTNSTVFGIHTNRADPDRVVACSVNGEVWASDDVGETWRLIKQTFGELNCIVWQPNSDDVRAEHTPTGMQAVLGGEVMVPGT